MPISVESPKVESNVDQGAIGVGTWRTQAEFRDVQVTSPEGKLLFASDFTNGSGGWQKLGEGQWKVSAGTLQQTSDNESVRAIAGDPSWTDYTLTLKARKLGGNEGFLILFHIANAEDETWWNLGGWGNTQGAIQNGEIVDARPEFIETGVWYDLKLVVSGKHVKCYLDGRLVHDVDYESASQVSSLYACAAQDQSGGDLIVKVVNTSALSLPTRIDLLGAKNLTGTGTATVLTSENPGDENSLENPLKVSPKTEAVNFSGASLTRSFPGNSLTVLRFQTRK